ncbi:MAG: KpsF/GutQ family sugar-phosphate isomerase [Pseudomonadota bacterium]
MPEPVDAIGRQVILTEADALSALAASLGSAFETAVESVLAAKGRVIVSGLGKSGHVARKIAATLASTGTPAYFVHPAEASHGDLGMITADDVLVMLSNSGENRELGDLIHHARRTGIHLIAITSRPDGTLARTSDTVLLLPKAPEACPMGLAPTTSSTMMLALGDALAVALMARRGFDRDKYRVLHPGGQLGKALLRVSDIMARDEGVPLVGPTAAMAEILIEMTSKRLGLVGVVDKEGYLMGVFSDGDLSRCMDETLMTKTAQDVMTKTPKTISSEALVGEAVKLMSEAKIQCLFVRPAGLAEGRMKPVGVLHLQNCLSAGVT